MPDALYPHPSRAHAETDESDASLDLPDSDDDLASGVLSSRMSSQVSGGSEQDELASNDGFGSDDDDDDDEGMGSGASAASGSESGSEAASSIYGGRKTARQRAKEMGGDEALELMSLPTRASSSLCLSLVVSHPLPAR